MMTQKVVLVMVLYGVMAASLVLAHKVEERNPLEEEMEEDDESEEMDWTLEDEVFGPSENRHQGIHILDEDHQIIMSEPSDRVLRLIAPRDGQPNDITIKQVKALYRKLNERNADHSQARYSKDNFLEMLAMEQQANKEKDAKQQDSLLKRLINLVW